MSHSFESFLYLKIIINLEVRQLTGFRCRLSLTVINACCKLPVFQSEVVSDKENLTFYTWASKLD